MVDGNKLNSVLEFTYLGSTMSSNGCIDDEIQRRMAKASASIGRLRQRLWNNHRVSMRITDKLYSAIVLSTLLYVADDWPGYRRQVTKLHAIMIRHLRSIMKMTWMDKVTNKEILERTAIYGRSSDQKESPVDWTPHEDATRHASKAGYLLSTDFWSHKERAPSSPVQRYHQEKPEGERHQYRLMDITLTTEINGEQQSSDGSSLSRFATDCMMMVVRITWGCRKCPTNPK